MKKILKVSINKDGMIDYPFFVAYRIANAYPLPLEWYLIDLLKLSYENCTIKFESLSSSKLFKECFSKYFKIRENDFWDVNNDITNFVMKSIINDEYILIPYYFKKSGHLNVTRLLIHGIDTDTGYIFSNKRLGIFELDEQCKYVKHDNEAIIDQDFYDNFLLENQNGVLRLKPLIKCQLLCFFNNNCKPSHIKTLVTTLINNTSEIFLAMADSDMSELKISCESFIYNCSFLLRYYSFVMQLLNNYSSIDDCIAMKIKMHCSMIERSRNIVIKQKMLNRLLSRN